MGQLIGFKRFETKDGRLCCVAIVSEKFSKRDVGRGCCGSKVTESYLPDDFYDFLNEAHIGHDISFDYNIVGSKAYVNDVFIK